MNRIVAQVIRAAGPDLLRAVLSNRPSTQRTNLADGFDDDNDDEDDVDDDDDKDDNNKQNNDVDNKTSTAKRHKNELNDTDSRDTASATNQRIQINLPTFQPEKKGATVDGGDSQHRLGWKQVSSGDVNATTSTGITFKGQWNRSSSLSPPSEATETPFSKIINKTFISQYRFTPELSESKSQQPHLEKQSESLPPKVTKQSSAIQTQGLLFESSNETENHHHHPEDRTHNPLDHHPNHPPNFSAKLQLDQLQLTSSPIHSSSLSTIEKHSFIQNVCFEDRHAPMNNSLDSSTKNLPRKEDNDGDDDDDENDEYNLSLIHI